MNKVKTPLCNELPHEKPNLSAMAEKLEELASLDPNILVLTSDSRGSGKLVSFGERFKDQIIEVGIAEQNLVGISAGLASAGKKVFAVSPACFLTTRALEQIKNDIAYSDNPVNLIGISAGVSYGPLGSTHHSLHDLSALRAIHNITIVAPADNYESQRAIELSCKSDHPVYIRFGKKSMPNLYKNAPEFEFGKAIRVKKGKDLAIIATGECVLPALNAAVKLEKEHGINARVISMHTIKPLDTDALQDAAKECLGVITVEEHSIHGGLGEACAANLLENGIYKPFRIIGIPDEYTVTGSQKEIFDYYNISEDGIKMTALELLRN
jgi:transketolase